MHIVTALSLIGAAVVTAGTVPAGHAQPEVAQATPTPGGPYYLALGDSLTSGYQPDGSHIPGYAHLFFQTLQAHGVVTQMLNLACSGESTRSLIKGGCPAGDPPNSYGGYPRGAASQLDAALAFIRAHPGHVRYVTIDIGVNDVYAQHYPPMTPWCRLAVTDAISGFHQVDTNLRTIYSRLRTALGSTGTLMALNLYDAYQNECARASSAQVSSIVTFNKHIARAAAAFHISVADVYSAFHSKTTPNHRLCVLTYICSKDDVHPTPAGHALIAAVLIKTAGY
jgi:lysophospholipase L1-like esterase